MTGALSLGRVAGIEVKVHLTFFLLLAWVITVTGRSSGDLRVGLTWAAFVVLLFGCVVLHELGHALVARRFGVRTRDIVLLPIGGVARLERIPEAPKQELLIAVAGPLVNLAIAATLAVTLLASGAQVLPTEGETLTSSMPQRLMMVNIALFVFNLIPAFPMDGGRVLRALLATRWSYVKATRAAARIGRGLAIWLAVLGVLANPLLLLIALFVWFGAGAEAALVEMRASLSGKTVAEVMETELQTLEPTDTLHHAAELTLAGVQRDFPVLDGHHRPMGLLTQARLLRGISEGGDGREVERWMEPVALRFEAGQPAREALGRLQEQKLGTGVVVDENQRFCGLLTLENLQEHLALERALRSAPVAHREATAPRSA